MKIPIPLLEIACNINVRIGSWLLSKPFPAWYATWLSKIVEDSKELLIQISEYRKIVKKIERLRNDRNS